MKFALQALGAVAAADPGARDAARPRDPTTVSGNELVPPVNDAVTVLDALKVTVQVVHRAGAGPWPPQPAKVAPPTGVATSWARSSSPRGRSSCRSLAPFPAADPAAGDVPLPLTETVSVKVDVGGAGPPVNVAVTLFDWFIDTVQVVRAPPQAPVQPANVAPVAGPGDERDGGVQCEVPGADVRAVAAVDHSLVRPR